MARALPALPRLSEAFSRGELSYSNVRALTRIADPTNEETLLGWAKAGTASHIESLVRKYRHANRLLENEQAEAREASPGVSTWFDSDGMRVVQGRLTPEQGALLHRALERASDEPCALPDGSAESRAPRRRAGEETDGASRLADALALVAERALAVGAAEGAGGDRFQVVVHIDREVLADPETDGLSELEDGPALAPDTARRIACDASVTVLMHGPRGALWPGRKTRVISAPLRRALLARDGTRCSFPGCGCRGRDARHVRHWASGGPTTRKLALANDASRRGCESGVALRGDGTRGVRASASGELGSSSCPAEATSHTSSSATSARSFGPVPSRMTRSPVAEALSAASRRNRRESLRACPGQVTSVDVQPPSRGSWPRDLLRAIVPPGTSILPRRIPCVRARASRLPC